MSNDHRQMFHQVLAEELREIDKRRRVLPEDAAPPDLGEVHGDDPFAERAVQRAALCKDLTGLALSGGGIRSATFALGVLQGLASFGLLRRFDYLSTVSGGGYIGSWLAAWIKREGTLDHVEQQLQPSRVDQARGRVLHPGPPLNEEPEPIRHLRAYSSYLAPKRGVFSADSWVLAATYLRNILLNQLVLLPLCIAILLACRLLEPFYNWHGSDLWNPILFWLMFGTIALALVSVIARTTLSRTSLREKANRKIPIQTGVWIFRGTIVIPLFLFAIFVSWDFGWDLVEENSVLNFSEESSAREDPWWVRLEAKLFTRHGVTGGTVQDPATPQGASGWSPWHFAAQNYRALQAWEVRQKLKPPHVYSRLVLLGFYFGSLVAAVALLINAVLIVFGWLGWSKRQEALGRRVSLGQAAWAVVTAFIAGFTGGALLYVAFGPVLWPIYDNQPYDVALVAALGPPLAVLAIVVSMNVAVGLLGTLLQEDEREWWASLTGWLLIYAVLWAGVIGLSLFGPLLIMRANAWGRALMGSAWVMTALAGVLAGKSPRTAAGQGNKALEYLARLAPPVFLVGLLAAIALLIDRAQNNLPTSDRMADYFEHRADANALVLLLSSLGFAVFGCVMALRVDVNAFSLHGLYADRLIRCYLGASRPKVAKTDRLTGAPANSNPPDRQPDPVTGFDPADDVALHRLRIGVDALDARQTYRGPFLLVNTAMNLTQGDELAWQERKAESFVLSPLYCGSRSTGFRRLDATDGDPLRLGTAITLSGAAVSPNMGYHSSPAVTGLLTAFNVRLGGWVSNPRHGIPGNSGPMFGPLYLLKELFGRTNNRASNVYLSDGGHFDNLGIYELVRRRCRYIVAVDGEQDADIAFGSLGSVIRKCESDFGVRIAIDVTPIRLQGEERRSRWHCAIGTIHYAGVEPTAVQGILVYLKASLTGDEPTDVLTYAREHPPFPHQTTLNQFFTESQFESYRSLGLHIAREVFRDAMDDLDNPPDSTDLVQRRVVNKLFSNLHRRWFPPPPDFEKTFLQSVQGYLEIEQALREDENLSEFSRSLYPELARDLAPNGQAKAAAAGDPAEQRRAQLHLTSQMLQVMEDVWLSIHLEGYFAHPMNRGWMNVFRRWTLSRIFRKYWPVVRGQFSRDFVRFCDKELSLEVGPVRAERLVADARLLGDQPAGEAEERRRMLAGLREEFHWEWPGEDRLETLIHRAWQGGPNAGNVWLLTVTPPDGNGFTTSDPCGLIVTWQPDASRREFELLVWMRGPYRDLGLGRAGILDAYRQAGARAHRDVALRTRLPKEHATGHAYEARSAMWQSFYSFYGFRPAPARKGEENYLILEAAPEQWRELLIGES